MDGTTTRCSINADDLARLLIDLRRIAADSGPSSADLRSAPLLDRWTIGFVPAACLTGAVYGHPILGDKARVTTSQLVMLEPSKSWARTVSRFYRLGSAVPSGLNQRSAALAELPMHLPDPNTPDVAANRCQRF